MSPAPDASAALSTLGAGPNSGASGVPTGDLVASKDPTRDLVASVDGLSLTVSFEPTDVAPGGALVVHVVIRNGRSVPVVLGDPCGLPTMSLLVPVLVDPVGRAWDGIAGSFKAYALKEGLGPIDRPEATSTRVAVFDTCAKGGGNTLAPGALTSTSLLWKADLVKGVPAPPGDIPVHVVVRGDPSVASPTYQDLAVDGVVHVVGEAPQILSAGQALDRMLADRKFATWLAKQPKGTWSNAHAFLEHRDVAQGIVPAGSHWDVELFREIGVGRNWAIGYVDAFTGKVSNLTFCNNPCDR
jgi:hypothetical protein